MADKIEKPSEYEVAQIIRTMIDTENKLINNRINWMISAQAFLLTSLAFIWGKQSGGVLLWLICGLGLMVSLAVLYMTFGAILALNNLWIWWNNYKSSNYDGPPVWDVDFIGYSLNHIPMLPIDFLTISFAIVWIVIIFFNVSKVIALVVAIAFAIAVCFGLWRFYYQQNKKHI
jgi:hypothetical protein